MDEATSPDTERRFPAPDGIPPPRPIPTELPPVYADRLDRDPKWALSEGSRHFDEGSAVFQALNAIARRLESLAIPYAVVGGMALFRHGLRRFTEVVGILVTKDDLKKIHDRLGSLGYAPHVPKSKHLRDSHFGVKVEFFTTGDYPGDGLTKPVRYPHPSAASAEAEGIRYLALPTLVELKLASGMTDPGRLKDLSDVLELIKALDLPIEYAASLDPYVRGKYVELWKRARKRYVTTWRNRWLTAEAETIEGMISALHAAAEHLDRMRQDGVILDDEASASGDCVRLVTADAKVAERYGLVDESEHWDLEEEDRRKPQGD